jgi:hypothetical protein
MAEEGTQRERPGQRGSARRAKPPSKKDIFSSKQTRKTFDLLLSKLEESARLRMRLMNKFKTATQSF